MPTPCPRHAHAMPTPCPRHAHAMPHAHTEVSSVDATILRGECAKAVQSSPRAYTIAPSSIDRLSPRRGTKAGGAIAIITPTSTCAGGVGRGGVGGWVGGARGAADGSTNPPTSAWFGPRFVKSRAKARVRVRV